MHRGDAVIAPSAYSPPVGADDSGAGFSRSRRSCYRVCCSCRRVCSGYSPAAGPEIPKATFIPAEHTSFEPVADYPHRELIEQLSPREFEVLGLIARGSSNAEITRSWYFRRRR